MFLLTQTNQLVNLANMSCISTEFGYAADGFYVIARQMDTFSATVFKGTEEQCEEVMNRICTEIITAQGPIIEVNYNVE